MYTIKVSKIVSYMTKKVNVIETCMQFKIYNLHRIPRFLLKNGKCPKTFEWEYTYFDNYIKEVS